MKRSLYLTLAASIVLACGETPPPKPPPVPPPPPPAAPMPPPPPTTTPDAPFRLQPPQPDGKITFVPPKIEEAKLKNGIRVLIAPRRDLPIVSVRVVIALGAGDVDARPGVMSFLGAMMEQGTKKRTALQLSDDFEAIGAGHSAWVDWDSSGTSLKVLTDRLDKGLELLADVTMEPTFPNDEIERFRARRIAGIQAEKSSPGTVAANAIAASLFGRAHPYGHSLTGEESDAKKVTRADIVGAYGRVFAPQNATLVVAGDVTKETLLPKLETAFGGWKNSASAAKRTPPKPITKAATDKRIVFVDKAGAQSQIQIIRPGVPHAHKDREAIIVTNAIFGGMFSSRVNLNLREKNAYTYGARSYFLMRHGAGPFQVGAPVFSEKTGPAIKEVFAEMEGLRKDGPTEEELALAKESIRLAMPGRFEASSDLASAVSELVVYDLPLDDYEKRLQRIDAVGAADVKRIANEYFGADAMTVVVVGDRKTVEPQLGELKLGAIDERDVYGNPPAPAAKEAPKDAPKK